MTCPLNACNGGGLISVSKDDDIADPCECAAGDRWRTNGERALRALFDAFEKERTA